MKALKSAAWIVFPGVLISLLLCMLILGSNIFEMLLPVWLGILFTVISFALTRIPFPTNKLWMKTAISAAVVIVTVICLRFFVK
jgi:membrane protein CcdC involved in cytochrome C biogenesis